MRVCQFRHFGPESLTRIPSEPVKSRGERVSVRYGR